MLRALLLLSLFQTSTPAAPPPAVEGRYRLKVPTEITRFNKVFGRPSPSGRLALLTGGVFDLQTEGAARHGRFQCVEGKLTLKADDGTMLSGERKTDGVIVEGYAFEPEPQAAILDMTGTWTVHSNGVEDKGCRMDLKKDGRFRFVMAGATSEGTWRIEDGKMLIVWTRVDGAPVEPGTMKKALPLGEAGDWFQIDSYRYERSSIVN